MTTSDFVKVVEHNMARYSATMTPAMEALCHHIIADFIDLQANPPEKKEKDTKAEPKLKRAWKGKNLGDAACESCGRTFQKQATNQSFCNEPECSRIRSNVSSQSYSLRQQGVANPDRKALAVALKDRSCGCKGKKHSSSCSVLDRYNRALESMTNPTNHQSYEPQGQEAVA